MSTNKMPTNKMPTNKMPEYDFKTMDHVKNIINNHAVNFSTNPSNYSQYLLFRLVNPKDLEEFDRDRRSLPTIRLTYNQQSKHLLVKLMPSVLHELAHRELGREIENALRDMHLPRYALASVGSGRFKSPRGNSKEGDTCYVPEARSPRGGHNWPWPSLVLEAGVSESLPQLRADAAWWFSDSDGDVKITILIGVDTHCQDPGPDKLYSTLRWLTSRSSICAFLAVA